ncbi:MAG: HEAT repeat domain-containing protein [Planctomycetota bacterium]
MIQYQKQTFRGRMVVLLGCLASVGCMPELRRPLSTDGQRQIRGEALMFLKEAVKSDDPTLRIQALEALQTVAAADGIPYIMDNIDNGYAGVSFAALMSAGAIQEKRCLEKTRIRAEDSDPHVRIAAIYALHRLGDTKRTSELGELLMNHPDARVRANAAVAIGRLGEKGSAGLLRTANHREKKDVVKMQIREALAMLHDQRATDELIFAGYSAVPDQALPALAFLAEAKNDRAEDLFRHRLHKAEIPELRLIAARGLGRLGNNAGYDIACAHLFFDSPQRNRKNDPPEQQVARVRSLAALALEAINDPDSLGPLSDAFHDEQQGMAARLAIARATVGITNSLAHRATASGHPVN